MSRNVISVIILSSYVFSLVHAFRFLKRSENRAYSHTLYEVQSSLVAVSDEITTNDVPPKLYKYHVDFRNFWRKTRAHFTPCERPKRSPDFKSKRSWYWDVSDDYVIRSSDHWSNSCGNIKDCFWTIDEEAFRENKTCYKNTKKSKAKRKKTWLTGKCYYADFQRGKSSSMKARINDRLPIT